MHWAGGSQSGEQGSQAVRSFVSRSEPAKGMEVEDGLVTIPMSVYLAQASGPLPYFFHLSDISLPTTSSSR